MAIGPLTPSLSAHRDDSLHIQGGRAEDAQRGTPPCSTFKIANTLIGLDTGVIPDTRFSLRWDGTKRDIEAWNRDHDVKSAMRDSVVWFYQEVARRIGRERMREGVARLRYGNARIQGPIYEFWLDDGSLLVTPREQALILNSLTVLKAPSQLLSAHVRDVVLRRLFRG